MSFLEQNGTNPTVDPELKQLVEHLSKQKVTVRVEKDPVVTTAYVLKKKVKYALSCEFDSDTFTAVRSYKEFTRLQYCIQNRFTGSLIPPLPLVHSDKSTLIEGIQHFMTDVARNPLIRNDSAFIDFCQNGSLKFKNEQILNASSQGIEVWDQITNAVPLPINSCDKTVLEISKEISSLAHMYKTVRGDMKNLHLHLKKQASEHKVASSLYTKWLGKEGNDYRELFGNITDPNNEWNINLKTVNMPTLVDNMKKVADSRVDTLLKESVRVLEESQHLLLFELGYLKQLSQLADIAKRLLKKNKAAMKQLTSLKNELKLVEENSEKYVQVKSKVDGLEAISRSKQEVLKVKLGAFIFEADRYRFDRTQRASSMFAVLLNAELDDMLKAAETCRTSLAQTPREIIAVSHLVSIGSLLKPASSYTVSHDFEAMHDDEISVKEGEEVTIVAESPTDDQWVAVLTMSGAQGLVPKNYLFGGKGEASLQVAL